MLHHIRTSQACIAYSVLVKQLSNSTTNTTSSARPNTDPLPWLYYQGNSYSSATDLGLKWVTDLSIFKCIVIFPSHSPDLSRPIPPQLHYAWRRIGSCSSSHKHTNNFCLDHCTFCIRIERHMAGISKLDKAIPDLWHWQGRSSKLEQVRFIFYTTNVVLIPVVCDDCIHVYSFGWDYNNQCQIGLTDILMELKDGCEDTVLYDIYIQNGAGSLYPIPVVISPNYQSTSIGNQGGLHPVHTTRLHPLTSAPL